MMVIEEQIIQWSTEREKDNDRRQTTQKTSDVVTRTQQITEDDFMCSEG